MFKNFLLFICFSIAFQHSAALAGPLIYRPVNPAFGGDPFNYSYLAGTAQDQRPERKRDIPVLNPVDDFASTIQRQLLSRISTDIVNQIYGENAQDSGLFEIGTTVISFDRVGNQINLVISDNTSGQSTNISLPVPQF